MTQPEYNSHVWPAWATAEIHIVPYEPAWREKAIEVRSQLMESLRPFVIGTIEHIGSTAVPGLAAKPIIDLIGRIPTFDNIAVIARALQPDGWHYVLPDLDQRPHRRFFIKVENDKRVAHLQCLLPDSSHWTAQVQFRDLLIGDQALRDEYADLKQESAERHRADREAYTRSKSAFIERALNTPPRIRIIFATNNEHKVKEIQLAIGGAIEVISLREAGIDIDIPEPHDTLEANATEKSETIHRLTGDNCFSEDTGLEVIALNGEPGVKSARYAGEDRAPDKNIDKLLRRLGHNADRRARFRTVISLIWGRQEHLFEGVCEGHILFSPAGKDGFGYDPVFVPDGDNRSFAQMSPEEKNRYSHRRKAADQLVGFLRKAAAPSQ
jgi:XTP/dITP diphosphohydrolase